MHSFFKKRFVQKSLSFIFAEYLRFVYRTSRQVIVGRNHIETLFQENTPAIIVFWHREMTMAPFAWKKGKEFRMLISSHGDGKLIAQTVQKFGISCIEGSSSHDKGTLALKKMLKALSEGISVGITPDGPRGPREVLKNGVYALARLSGRPVLALHWNSTAQYVLKKTWDQMKIPLPFGRIEWVWSPPITLQSHSGDQEKFQKSLYDALS
ncbi:lysophospholipid acyltransferase family protein [Holospora undulata]|uniref:DUF374 domain-containing protein n=1 Tax=Holospora undulata HU1 TaxID=1321371 RepID=A0A061JIS7_9PROT|nr:lysophospholipid acyltransferase family protein [Holospora undulata]ETZ05084.1 hypothetical protein K737_300488 [Holospora undulata HU1]